MTRPLKHEFFCYVNEMAAKHGELGLDNYGYVEEFIYDAEISNDDIGELADIGELLHQRGLLHLPYDDVLLQIPIDSPGACLLYWMMNGKLDRWIEGKWHGDAVHVFPYGWSKEDGCHKAIDDSFAMLIRDQSALTMVKTTNMKAEDGPAEHACCVIALAALALLHIKGIERERLEPSAKLNKARLKRRQIPIDAATVVRIQKHLAAGLTRGTVAERLAPRLHLRRGHIRLQPYGPRLHKHRQIWIADCVVGYRDEGVISHHYEIDETRH